MARVLARGLPPAAVAIVTSTSPTAVFIAPAMTAEDYDGARELAELLHSTPRITLPRPKKKRRQAAGLAALTRAQPAARGTRSGRKAA